VEKKKTRQVDEERKWKNGGLFLFYSFVDRKQIEEQE
jgi:hypothetical protein